MDSKEPFLDSLKRNTQPISQPKKESLTMTIKIPQTMKAIGYKHAGVITAQDSLVDITLPVVMPEGRDLLVAVKAISVNPVDVKIRANVSSQTDTYKVLGWDVSGIVVAKGADATEFNIGDEVFYAGDLTRQGSNSEYHLIDERIVGRKPMSISHEAAAALPLTAITAWEMLFDRFGIEQSQKDESILIIGGAGGVSSIAIQLLKAKTHLTVIGTASRAESKQWVKSMGADFVINHNESLADQLKTLEITPKYVFSTNHSDQHCREVVALIQPQGHFGLIDDPETLDITAFKVKSTSIHWEFMYTRSMFKTSDMAKQGELLTEVARLVDAGIIQSTLTESFGVISAENLKKAHTLIESGRAIGKVVLAGF